MGADLGGFGAFPAAEVDAPAGALTFVSFVAAAGLGTFSAAALGTFAGFSAVVFVVAFAEGLGAFSEAFDAFSAGFDALSVDFDAFAPAVLDPTPVFSRTSLLSFLNSLFDLFSRSLILLGRARELDLTPASSNALMV